MDQETKDEWMLQVLGEQRRQTECLEVIAREIRNLRAHAHGPTAEEERLIKRLIQEA